MEHNQDSLKIFIWFNRFYLNVNKLKFAHSDVCYGKLFTVIGNDWNTDSHGFKITHQTKEQLEFSASLESENSIWFPNNKVFAKQYYNFNYPDNPEYLLSKFYSKVSLKNKKRIIKAYKRFKLRNDVYSFRSLWRALNRNLAFKFRIQHKFIADWASLDIYTKEEFEMYKKALLKANKDKVGPSYIHNLTVDCLTDYSPLEMDKPYSSVESLFGNQELPLGHIDTPKKSKFTTKVKRIINNYRIN